MPTAGDCVAALPLVGVANKSPTSTLRKTPQIFGPCRQMNDRQAVAPVLPGADFFEEGRGFAVTGTLGGVHVRGSYVLGPEAASNDDGWDELQRAEADEF